MKMIVMLSILSMLACGDSDLKDHYMGGVWWSEGLGPYAQCVETSGRLKDFNKDLESRLNACNDALERIERNSL